MRISMIAGLFMLATITPTQAATVNLIPSAPGVIDSFSVLVSASDFPETEGATLGLTFDSDLVRVSGVRLAADSPFDTLLVDGIDNAAGRVDFISVLAPLVGALPAGDFDAFVIDFRVNLFSGGGGTIRRTTIELVEDAVLTGWTGADFALIPDVVYNSAVVAIIPVPAAAWLLLSGLGGLGLWSRRRG